MPARVHGHVADVGSSCCRRSSRRHDVLAVTLAGHAGGPASAPPRPTRRRARWSAAMDEADSRPRTRRRLARRIRRAAARGSWPRAVGRRALAGRRLDAGRRFSAAIARRHAGDRPRLRGRTRPKRSCRRTTAGAARRHRAPSRTSTSRRAPRALIAGSLAASRRPSSSTRSTRAMTSTRSSDPAPSGSCGHLPTSPPVPVGAVRYRHDWLPTAELGGADVRPRAAARRAARDGAVDPGVTAHR